MASREIDEKRESACIEVRFLVDGMLGSLARKLRILGYDTVYDKQSSDSSLLKQSRREERVLVTSDVVLHQQAMRRGLRCALLKASDGREQLSELFSKVGVKRIDWSAGASRCSLCNGVLLSTDRQTPEGRAIYECPNCGKTYWRGGHWRKLEKLFRELNSELRTRPEVPAVATSHGRKWGGAFG